MNTTRISFSSVAMLTAVLLAFGPCLSRATTIQLSPDVGRRGIGHYRSPSYYRTLDQYDNTSDEYYNIALGNLRLAITGTLDARWTDNVDLASDSDLADEGWAIIPGVQLNVDYPLTPSIRINSGIGVAYEMWLDGDTDDKFLVTGTDGAFNAHVDVDVLLGQTGHLTIAEEFQRDVAAIEAGIDRDSGEDFAITRNIVTASYQNVFSDTISGSLKLTHMNQWVDDRDYEDREFFSDSIDAMVLWRINSFLQVGPYGRYEWTFFTEDGHNDADKYDVGASFVYQRSAGMVFHGSAGYQVSAYSDDNVESATDDYRGLSATVGTRLATTEYIIHRLVGTYGANHEFLSGEHNFAEQLGLSYTLSLQLREDFVVNSGLTFLHVEESDDGENANTYIFELGVGWRVTDRTTIDAKYRRALKLSDISDREYRANTIEFGLTHRF